jgi:hypothetical protein
MASTTFTTGTTIASTWLNDVNTATYTDIPAIKANNWVTTTRINDGAVTTAKHADQSVTTAKIADANVTPAKLANSGYELGLRNRIINGGMRISQRGTLPLSANTSLFGGADRMQTYIAASTITGGSMASAPFAPAASGYGQYAGPVTGTGVTSVQFLQRIEASNCADLNGKSITITAGFYHDTGVAVTGTISLLKANSIDNFSSTTTIATSPSTTVTNVTNTKLTFTVTLGAADASNGLQVNLTFSFASTSLSGRSFVVSDLQLENGAVSTPFEFRPYGTELALCQRYYESTGGFNQATGASNAGSTISFAVTKRAAPTVTFSNITYSSGSSLIYQNPFGNVLTGIPFNWLSTSAGGYVNFTATASAEL